MRRDSESSLALLSVRRDPDSVIDGLLVIDQAQNLPSVDLREQLYRRVPLVLADLELSGSLPRGCPVYVYEASMVHPPVRLDIIQSYLDAVLQGFLREFGRGGVERFIAETEGFDARLIADRKKPNYPRSVVLGAEEEVYFDALIAQIIPEFAPFVR
ncbi:gamma-glutamylcyclotransferase [Nitratireductor sp. GISD-1A_MAKvit]|uniref:gamma-glutamylcyclotransferase n=1 Tax=Nitratireductor sp. GISD-1A_MAKvit TaxID=3234198 RepID=UPI003466F5A4